MADRPVLYLDLDDTIITWADGSPRAAPGAREFVEWALDRFAVRWLTTWCPGGEMEEALLGDLAKMLSVEPERLAAIRGGVWDAEGSKVNGVAWLEHIVRGRPFVWLEDGYGFGERERGILAEHGLLESYVHCNVTEDPQALVRVHRALGAWVAETGYAAA